MIPLSFATGDYDHMRDVLRGDVPVRGVDLTWLELPVEEIFQRFSSRREWDVSEFSMALYVALKSSGDTRLTALPVFPSRMFRHAAVFVRAGEFSDAAQLAGRRIGVPEWAQTAGVWMRGILAEHHGVDLHAVRWVQGGLDRLGRHDRVPLSVPDGISVERVADRTLEGMLLAGELDAIISARIPKSFEAEDPRIARLWTDWAGAERAYFSATGIHPMMHVVALRSDVVERHRWLARNLMIALDQARARSLDRLQDMEVSRTAVPWFGSTAGELAATTGNEWFPYGVEANRPALETFVRYAVEQGVASRHLDLDELFDASATFEPQF